MATPSERNEILQYLHTLAIEDVVKLWRATSAMDVDGAAFRQIIIEAYPEIAAQWSNVAADLAVGWYNESAPELDYRAVIAPPPEVEQLASSAQWALNTATGDGTLALLAGSIQRAVWNGARDTISANVAAERGSRWVRHASANACAFCRMLATRSLQSKGFYSSAAAATQVVGRGKEMSESDRRARARGETRASGRFIAGGRRTRGSRGMGEKFHDHCHCISVEVRPGRTYEPPSYVSGWLDDYKAASSEAAPGAGAGDVKQILSIMRRNTGAK